MINDLDNITIRYHKDFDGFYIFYVSNRFQAIDFPEVRNAVATVKNGNVKFEKGVCKEIRFNVREYLDVIKFFN